LNIYHLHHLVHLHISRILFGVILNLWAIYVPILWMMHMY